MKKTRSIGVTIFSIYFICCSILSMVFCIKFYGWNWHTYYAIIMGIISIILAIGILQLREWARRLVIFFHIYTALVNSIMTVMHQKKYPSHGETWIEHLVVLIFSTLVVIYFFTRPKVMEQFK